MFKDKAVNPISQADSQKPQQLRPSPRHTNYPVALQAQTTDICTYIPIFLLRLRGSTGTSFAILRRYITTLLEGGIFVLKDMLNAKLLPLQTRLGAWAMSE